MATKKRAAKPKTVSNKKRASSKKPATAKNTKAKPKAKASAKEPSVRTLAKASTKESGLVTIDRRRRSERRSGEEKPASPKTAAEEQRKLTRRAPVSRRRQIDPTTCERDYTDEEIAFMNALDDYKRRSGRQFPTCSEVLEVIRGLGYTQGPPAGTVPQIQEAEIPPEAI